MAIQLCFGPDDDERFAEARDHLLAELAAWAERADRDITADDSGAAGLLLDWRVHHSTGELDRFDAGDLEEFLLRWCPLTVAVPPEDWPVIVDGAQAWVRFLVSTGRWTGGPARPLLRTLDRIRPRFLQEMGDPANHGLGKRILGGGSPGGPADLDLDLDIDEPEALRAALDAFDELPAEARARPTDELFAELDDDTLGLAPGLVDLPLTPAADPERAATEAAQAPIVRQFEALRRHVGDGITLTQRGNPKLADARAMVAALETADVPDPSIGERQFKLRTADELPHLGFLLDVALKVRAVRRNRGKLVAVKAWSRRSPVEQVRACLEAMVALGPLTGRYRSGYLDSLDELCEDGLLPWMAVVYVAGHVDVDELLVEVQRVAEPALADSYYGERPDLARQTIARRMAHALDVVERCAVVAWTGSRIEEHEYGSTTRTGGTLQLTELGRLLLPELLLPIAGYRPHTDDELVDLAADELLARLVEGGGLDPTEVWAAWRPDEADGDKAAAMVDAFARAGAAEERLVALSVLSTAPEAAAPHLRALAGSALAGHVTLFLSERGLADEHELERLAPEDAMVPLVDALASTIADGPQEVVDYFDEAIPPEGRAEVLSLLSRVGTDETPEVLDVLGRHHGDGATARAARKAAIVHRSRSANRR